MVPRPKDNSIVSSEWIFKKEHSTDGSIENFKARLDAQGFSKKEVIYYEENFAPVARYTSIKIVLSLAAKMKWNRHQMDAKKIS